MRGAEDVGGSGSADGDDRVARSDSAKEKFEGSGFIAAECGGVEVVALDPELAGDGVMFDAVDW